MRLYFVILCCLVYLPGTYTQTLKTPFEKNNNQTSTYEECIQFYKALEKKSGLVKVIEAGDSDVSLPIYTVILSSKKQFSPEKCRKAGKAILMINNGIHPGEPDGIEAGMLFARDLALDQTMGRLLDSVTVVIIPVYNVGGSLNRTRWTRVNQNGPDEYGFRGNVQNLDLNRDFIKCDSRNAKTFTQCFQYWNPDVFLETHTTNGADYPYLMTLISSQRHKLQIELGNYMYKHFIPSWIRSMHEWNLEVIPYVNADGDPAKGIYEMLDSPRFSTGYAALFHCMGFMAEAHMLKPFSARVASHKLLMQHLALTLHKRKTEVLQARKEATIGAMSKRTMDIRWEIDKTRADSILYKGYLQEKSLSKVTGLEKIHYNPTKGYSKKIPFYNVYQPVVTVQKPIAYVVPAAYEAVVERLKLNGIDMKPLPRDTLLDASYYKITDYGSVAKPYEQHYLHPSVKLETVKKKRLYLKGDFIIHTHQPSVRYIVETLEPEAHDSFFAWNFFDAILQRKEYYSDYLFEPLAEALLMNDSTLREAFEQKKKEDPEFVKNSNAMLEFLYDRSVYAEPGYRIYPVARILED